MADQLQKLQRRIEDQEMYVAKQKFHGSRASVADGLRKLSIMRTLREILIADRGAAAKRPPAPSETPKKRKQIHAAVPEGKAKRAGKR